MKFCYTVLYSSIYKKARDLVGEKYYAYAFYVTKHQQDKCGYQILSVRDLHKRTRVTQQSFLIHERMNLLYR